MASGEWCGAVVWPAWGECQQPRESNSNSSSSSSSSRAQQQGEQAGQRLFGCEEAGTTRHDETLSPAKEGRSPGRPGNDSNDTQQRNRPKDAPRLTLRETANNTLISSSSLDDLRTLPVSLSARHLLSTVHPPSPQNARYSSSDASHSTLPGQTSQARSSNFAPPSRSPN